MCGLIVKRDKQGDRKGRELVLASISHSATPAPPSRALTVQTRPLSRIDKEL